MYKTIREMADMNSAIQIVMLNVNGLNNPVKRQRLSEHIKNGITICCLQETQVSPIAG